MITGLIYEQPRVILYFDQFLCREIAVTALYIAKTNKNGMVA